MTTHLKIAVFVFLLVSQIGFGQERIITIKVRDEDFTALPGVMVKSNSKEIGMTDLNGNFQFKLTPEINYLEFVFLGLEAEKVMIKENCNNIELIMLNEATYCFVSLKAAERKIKRNRKRKIPKLYNEAYESGVFTNTQSCR